MPTKFFGTVRPKIFDGKMWYPPFHQLNYSKPDFFPKNNRIPWRSFSALWDKIFSAEFSDIPFLCIKFCDTRIFLKHRTVPQRHFLVLCDKSFRRRNVIPLPLWCISFFDTPNVLKHWRDAHDIFQHFGTKIFRRKNVIPPITHKIFRYQSFSGKEKGSFTNLFVSVLWDKKFWQNRDAPPLLRENFRNKNFFETQDCSPMEYFWQCETKFFQRSLVISSSCA